MTPTQIDFLKKLADVAAFSIGRKDTQWRVFHGCWDWHSAVHSHWAIIRVSRATGDRSHDVQVQRSLLRPGGIPAEARLLRDRPSFEMPYGRAWFLRLVIDYELHFEDTETLRAMGDEVFASLLDHYRSRPPGPRDREYANASWACAQMLAYARHTGATSGAESTRALVLAGFDAAAASELSFADDPDPRAGFFSRYGNWIYLVSMIRPATEVAALLEQAVIAPADLAPVEKLYSDHHLGMNPSRAWALAALARVTGAARWERAWREHLAAMIATHREHAGDYRAYDHWVPSFCVYALTEPRSPVAREEKK